MNNLFKSLSELLDHQRRLEILKESHVYEIIDLIFEFFAYDINGEFLKTNAASLQTSESGSSNNKVQMAPVKFALKQPPVEQLKTGNKDVSIENELLISRLSRKFSSTANPAQADQPSRFIEFISLCTKNKSLINKLVIEVAKADNDGEPLYKSFERNILYLTDLLDFETKQILF